MKKMRIEIYLRNGIRCVVTDKSDKRNVQMFEAASAKLQRRRKNA